MDSLLKAKRVFKLELGSFLDNPEHEGDALKTVHKLKGGAGMLQLVALRETLAEMQKGLTTRTDCSHHITQLKRLHAELPD